VSDTSVDSSGLGDSVDVDVNIGVDVGVGVDVDVEDAFGGGGGGGELATTFSPSRLLELGELLGLAAATLLAIVD
jgi:hypothetical protein|tara:strand:+ start:828 stop:1052 length:225 start_codon:yes stop_codon:yes gene_type:complete